MNNLEQPLTDVKDITEMALKKFTGVDDGDCAPVNII